MKYLMTFLIALLVMDINAQVSDAQRYNANVRLTVASSNSSFNSNVSWVVGGSLFIISEETTPKAKLRISETIEGLRVYPIPTKDRLVVSYYNSDKNQPIRFNVGLYDLNGSLLYRHPMQNNRMEIDLIKLPSAIYLVKVFDSEGNEIKTYKIVKN